MLKTFKITNSYGFISTQELDLSKGKEVGESPEYVRGEDWNRPVLPIAAIYGANASGKTMLLRALADLASDASGIVAPLMPSDDSDYTPYLQRRPSLVSREPEPTEYFICVVIPRDYDSANSAGTEYQLSVRMDRTGVLYEELQTKQAGENNNLKRLYRRQGQEIDGGAEVTVNNTIGLFKKELIKEPGLVFPAIASRSNSLKDLFVWFRTVNNMLRFDHHFDFKKSLPAIAQTVSRNKEFKDMLSYVVHSMDTNVIDIVANQTVAGEYYLSLIHRKDDGTRVGFPVEWESNGTKRIIELFPWFYEALAKGEPLIVDELDRMLHPEAFRAIVMLFNSKETNPYFAQLIFVAHDTVVMNGDFLRRDEIHLMTKNADGASEITRLDAFIKADGKPVEAYSNYEELYRYGVIGNYPTKFMEEWRSKLRGRA